MYNVILILSRILLHSPYVQFPKKRICLQVKECKVLIKNRSGEAGKSDLIQPENEAIKSSALTSLFVVLFKLYFCILFIQLVKRLTFLLLLDFE